MPITNPSLTIVGLMSGTSADGIDAAVARLEDAARPVLLAHLHQQYSCDVRNLILDLCRPGHPVSASVSGVSFLLGELFAEAALAAIELVGMKPEDVDAIGSHGQTVWHQPEPVSLAGRAVTSTMQIGEAAVIAEKTGIVVVSDFRTADMAAGGQGAPLVPFADLGLFGDEHVSRAIQNIGGIANVTYLPAGCTQEQVIAFDTGPGNVLIDAAMHRLTGGKELLDTNGRLAASGEVRQELLGSLMAHPFLSAPPPKSTGRAAFGEHFLDEILQWPQAARLSGPDVVATLTAFTAESIAEAYERFLPSVPDEVVLGGGGSRNSTLTRMIEAKLAPAHVRTHEDFGIPATAKEALAFAILAAETLRGRPSNLPTATGAAHPAILGKVSYPYG